MVFKIFGGDDKENKNVEFLRNNLYGDWIYINNEYLNTFNEILEKTVKKLGIKRFENYFVEINFDDRLKNILYVKGFIESSDDRPINQFSFEHNFQKIMKGFGTANINFIKILKYCNKFYVFFNIDLMLKKVKKQKKGKLLPLLLPPSGLSLSEIPYEINDMFKKLIERNGNLNCSNISTELFESLAKIDATCRLVSSELNKTQLNDTFKYFSLKNSEPKIDIKKNNPNTFELIIYIPDFSYTTLVPLTWDRISQITTLC